ncbi:MAG TPA: hypothetical protein VNO30_10815 [Kofleriaceae bacterium]|nr:hypothetical protein [Kofleriaceae bacterium]
MTSPEAFFPLHELADPGRLPFGDFLDDVVKHLWITPPSFDNVTNEGVIGVFVDEEVSFTIPGIPAIELALGSIPGGVDVEIRVRFHPTAGVALELPLTLRVDAEVLRPLKDGTDDPDLAKKTLDIKLGSVRVGFDVEGNFTLDMPSGITLPRCMVGSTGVILSASDIRWLVPGAVGSPSPSFTGLHIAQTVIQIVNLPIDSGRLSMEDAYIGTGGFSGRVNWTDPSATWNGPDGFSGVLTGDLVGFSGALTKVELAFKQSALTECEIEGNIFVPYLDRVVGLSLGFDGNGAITAIAKTPTCQFTEPAQAAAAGPSGYIITADTDAFTLDISRVEFHAGGIAPAALALSGRAKLKISAFELPGVVFKGLRIDTQGHVAVEGGWLEVDTAKSAGLNGFPFQITRIGFGAETPRKRWIGLNGALKLADGLPIGASVEGLRVTWDLDTGKVSFTLEGIGLELRVPGTFSFAGKVAFFENDEATGFRGTLKLKLETVNLTIDAGLMIGRTKDGVTFFFFFLDVGLPAGIPLFATGAAIYGFAGLLATNLKPARVEGENWYYGYYKRPPIGVTDPAKWGVQRDGFAIGLGTTLGSLPDTGFAFSAKVLLILVLPGPQLLLQGKGQLLSKKPDEKKADAEGTFEALLVLDIPAKLFQANLAVAFKIADVIEVSAGVDVAFSWSPTPPADLWHIYLGEKTPAERRIHASIFKMLKGDSWLMINRTHSWPPGLPDRQGDFEIGGSIGVKFGFDFAIVKAWLDASMMGQAAITWAPQQFTASLTLKGSAGVSALGLSIVANLLADAQVKAARPWHIWMLVEVGLKIDLLFFKWEFHARLPLEFGDEKQPLPEPLAHIVTLHADHIKVDEARRLGGAVVAPDARPLIVFDRPVQDRARFGSPGRDDVEPENLGLRQFSYQLRHVVLIATSQGAPRLVAAAGEVTVSGTTASFAGFLDPADRLPDLAGAELTLLRPGQTFGPFIVGSGGGDTATIDGSPPQGLLSYRLSAVRPRADVQITGVGDVSSGVALVAIADTLQNPSLYRGGKLMVDRASWLILEATAGSVRIRVESTVPSSGAASLVGPQPPALEGKWYPAGAPVTGPDSSTRLQIGARTPYSFFRHNELAAIAGLDAFRPDYACGPKPVEEPICTTFDDVTVGALAGAFTTAGLPAVAGGTVAAVVAGSGPAKRLELGDFASGRGTGSLVFTFDPPADAVWVTAEAREAGRITATYRGAILATVPLERRVTRHEINGGIDRIAIEGVLASVYSLCFTPGWTCLHFEAASFPRGQTGRIEYAGVTLMSEGVMAVDVDTLVVDPPAPPPRLEHDLSRREIVAGVGRVWRRGSQAELATVTIEFPRPVTRVRVLLGGEADVIAFAGQREVRRGKGAGDMEVSLYADPAAPAHIGWMDRIVIVGPSQVRVTSVCTDAGDFGWRRFEQWKWSQGVQRSVESLYSVDPVLAPGTYELRIHTTTVVTGALPKAISERTSEAFIVGMPPGAPLAPNPDVLPKTYPSGGPLTDLATYVAGTLPHAGAKLWYRSYDTAVRFNEAYVTRMYLEAGQELTVSVVDASHVPIRSGVRHVWSGSDSALDAWTDLYIRTLNGDGSDRCATVDVDKVIRPEQVTVGSGEPLGPAQLHASELRPRGQDSRVLHRFEFTTSAFASFRHHLAVFDGRCRRLTPNPAAVASSLSPRQRADARTTQLAKVSTAVATARAAQTAATGNAPASALDAVRTARLALAQVREETRALGAKDFDEIWAACFGAQPPSALPGNVRISVVEAVTQAAGTDVLLLESPEPIAWERVTVVAARANATPQRTAATTLNTELGRPDSGFEVLFGGIRWMAGVELWVVDGALRARANEPLSVTILPERAHAVELVIRVEAGGSASITATPPLPGGPIVHGPSTSAITVSLRPAPGALITSVLVSGSGVAIESCSVTSPLVPIPPAGPLRIADIRLPTVTTPLDHEVTLLALEEASTEGYSIRWFDALAPGPTQLYAELAALHLKAGQRIRRVPARASAPPVDDALVQAGGAGISPAMTGAVFQLIDPAGRVVHECAAMPVPPGSTPGIVAFPSEDGTRAFFAPTPSESALGAGHWVVSASLAGDAGPDLDRWSIADRPVAETAHLRFLIF